MTQDNKLTAKPKKARQKQEKRKLTDMFTALCRSDLGAECEKEFRFHPKRLWRFDYAFPEHKVALEVEGGVWSGGRHTSPKGFLRDMEKYNTATLMGWRVLRTTPDELYLRKTLNMLECAISGEFEPILDEKCSKNCVFRTKK